MALHTDTEIYKATYDLCKLVTNMQRNYKADFGAELRKRCMALLKRGHAVEGLNLEKVFRKSA